MSFTHLAIMSSAKLMLRAASSQLPQGSSNTRNRKVPAWNAPLHGVQCVYTILKLSHLNKLLYIATLYNYCKVAWD